MKTDTIFYEIFKEFPQIFFELIGQPNINTNAYQFIAPEIKQHSFRLDGVFFTLENFLNQPLYFVEVQFYKDEEFYDRLFTSIFSYFSQYRPQNADWYAIVIYERRSHESSLPPRYRALVEPHLRRIYLDELGEAASQSLGVGIVKLIVESDKKTSESAKHLIAKVREELTDTVIQERVLEFIKTIVVYKFPNLSPKEIEVMLNLDIIRGTRVYQEAEQEGRQKGKLEAKFEIVPKLLEKGLTIQEVSELLDLDIESVRKAAHLNINM